jgi:hypothetical protein
MARTTKPAQSVYDFDDWTGSEDVFMICQKYIDELKTIVEDGRNKKFLT